MHTSRQLLGARTLLGLETKRPKERPKKLPLFDTSVVPNRKVMIDLAECPIFIMLAVYDAPCIIGNFPLQNAQSRIWLHFLKNPDTQLLARKYGLFDFALSSLDIQALGTTLAKIAHAYTVAEIGLENFLPLLPNFICGNYFDWTRYYIGGRLEVEPPGESLHEISFEEPMVDTWQYYIVRLRLFSNLGGPVYRIVSGVRLNPTAPDEVLMESINAARVGSLNLVEAPLSHPVPMGLWQRDNSAGIDAKQLKSERYYRLETKPT